MFEQFKLYIFAIAAALIFFAGYKFCDYKRDSQELALQKQVDEAKETITKKQDEIEVLHEEYRTLEQKKQQVIYKKVYEYIPTGNMSPDWLLSYDCSAISASEDSTCELNGYATAVRTDRDALIVATRNNLACNTYRQQLIDLQSWVHALFIKN